MTNDDRVAALKLAGEPQKRDKSRHNIGGLSIEKTNGKGAYGELVTQLLWANNGTYRWDRNDPANGTDSFDNIYQAMAADAYAPGGRQRDRIQISAEYEADMRSGVASAARWLDEQFGIPVYRCKEAGSGNLVTTITVHPDYVVDPVDGTTAKEAQRERDKKALGGQARATLKRLIRDEGDAVRDILKDEVLLALNEPVPAPKRRMLED